MSKYLIKNFKGQYRLKLDCDTVTHDFPRCIDGKVDDDYDVYIDCYHGCKIFHYGHNVLEAYIPKILRGRNYTKQLKDVIFDMVDNDTEVTFKFKRSDFDSVAKILKPKTSGSSIGPYSSRNLPKEKYEIPHEEIAKYKDITRKVPKEKISTLGHITKRFLRDSIPELYRRENKTRKKIEFDTKEDMKKSGLKGKEYIHHMGDVYWTEFLSFLKEEVEKEGWVSI